MPLLGRKIFSLVKPLNITDSSEQIYTISQTKEQFRSKDDYEKRVALYEDSIWTCQCTGHVNLTYEEALDSEEASKKTLKQQFIPCYEKAVLEVVHHSTDSLDTLVDKSWTKLQQVYVKDELLMLKVKAGGKTIKGHVTKIERTTETEAAASNCSSPSSDKENTNTDTKTDTPKKWTPPKLLPYKYCIRLEGDEKIINSIPAVDLGRVDRPPSKDLLRLFIRSHSLRPGANQSSPWTVDEELVKKYSLPNKFAALFVSPLKMAELGRKSLEGSSKKRKQKLKSPGEPKAKKAKKDDKTKNKKDSKTKKPTPKKSKTIDVDSDTSDDLTLAQVKKGDTPKKTPSKKSKSPKKSSSKTETSDSDSDLFTLASIKEGTPKKLISSAKRKSTPKKGENTPKRSAKSPNKKGQNEKTPQKKKGLKQMTLFDMKKGSSGPPKSPRAKIISPPRLPSIAVKLRKALKDNKEDLIKQFTLQAARDLTTKQREKLPAELKEIVVAKFNILEHKRKLKNMTPEEKAEYYKEKKKEAKKNRQVKSMEQRKRFEDQDLDLKALPIPKIVPMPDGLPNECFGEVAMVTEFLRCFGGLLMPEDEYPIHTDALMKSLVSGKEGFVYLSRAVTTLLQTLLQDEIAEDYKELGVQLSDIPVNQYTASELVRLCLRKNDAEGHSEEDSEDGIAAEIDEVAEDLIEQLESCELFEMKPEQKLQVLTGLCHRILGTYSIQDYMEDRQRDSTALWKEKIAELKEKNDLLKKEKQKKKEEKEKEMEEQAKEGGEKTEEKKDDKKKKKSAAGMKPLSFYGQDQKKVEEEPADLASVVKRRREMAAKSAEEKKEREREERERREREYEINRKERDKENFQKKFDEGIALAKKVLRQSPIGTDRNHSRYWVFHHTTPGVFIEKGWASHHIDYSYKMPGDETTSDDDDDEDSSSDDESDNGSRRGKRDKDLVETTKPHCGQNLWFTYDLVKDIDTLLECLHPQGYREGALREEIKKKYEEVCKAVRAMQRANLELRSCNGEEEMLSGLKQELLETEIRLRSGGLGGVQEFDKWEQTLNENNDVQTLGSLLIETRSCIAEKFLQGIMGKKKKPVKVEEKTEDDEESKEEEEEKVPEGILKWVEAVESASSLSRLHVLLGIMDSCIRWEKSAENAKCKICRRKGNDEKLLLCDDCNQPFHLYCLRPALLKIPDGDWFCPACIPDTQRRRSKVVNYRKMAGSSDDESEESDVEDHEEECAVCGGDEDLICCAECPSSYHIYCHNPPLRHNPRGTWVCEPCKTGVKRRSQTRGAKNKRKTKTVKKQPVYTEVPSEEEEEEILPQKRNRTSRSRRAITQDSSEDEVTSPRRGSTRSRKQRSYAEETTEDDDDTDATPPPAKSRKSSPRKSGTEDDTPSGRRGSSRSGKADTSMDTSPVCNGRGSSRALRAEAAMTGAEKLQKCEEILNRLTRHRSSWPFRDPVNKEEVPDYYDIIKKPMDLQTMKRKVDSQDYDTHEDFINDMKLLIDNSFDYNHFSSEVGRCTQVFEKQLVDALKNFFPSYAYSRGPVLHDQAALSDHGYSSPEKNDKK